MTFIVFIVILSSLVFVHEFGHFLIAKLSGTRVDEFGIGFPPRIASFKKGETRYSINIVPFGGFVRIYGENPEEVEDDLERSFTSKSKWWQVAILIAGVVFNVIFAWLLISFGFIIGQPIPVDYQGPGKIENPQVVVLGTFPDSPAVQAGIKIGDTIRGVSSGSDSLPEVSDLAISRFIQEHQNNEIQIEYSRGSEKLTTKLTPQEGIVEGQKVVGLSFDMIGTLKLSFFPALWQGLVTTLDLTKVIAVELSKFFGNIFIGQGDLSQVTGPVGIVSLVGDASRLGLVHLLSFTAIISIHLAIINLIPFPALDGGRILFVAIEAILKKPISVKIFQYANLIGFVLLILLMIIVTYSDIVKLI